MTLLLDRAANERVGLVAAVAIGERIADYKGLAKRSNFLAFSMTVLLFSLAGIPPLAGFASKVVLFSSPIMGTVEGSEWMIWLAVAGIINSAISLYYYARVVKYMDVDELEEILARHRPGLIYTIPNFHNPTGACLDGQRRRRLISLAGRFDVPVLEDDYVGDIRYEGHAQPTLKSLDPDGRVIYMSTFSKMLIPGLRVGFVVADGPVYGHLLRSKRCHDLATCNLIQRALKDYVSVGRYAAHLQRSCTLYRRRRDAMLAALERHMPDGSSWVRPKGGLFVWARLPEGMQASELLPKACGEGMIFAPGGNFHLDPAEGEGCMRLNFASNSAEVIEEGIRRLGRAMRGD